MLFLRGAAFAILLGLAKVAVSTPVEARPADDVVSPEICSVLLSSGCLRISLGES